MRFTRDHVLTGSPEDAVAVLLVGAVVAAGLRVRRAEGVPATWWRAGTYFSVCLLVGWASGVLSRLFRTPVIEAGQPGDPEWRLSTALVFAVVVVGYAGVWRAGTRHHGRDRHGPSVVAFGLAWGVAEGVLLLSFWAAAEAAGLDRTGASVAAVLVASIWLGGWHAAYWDRRVAPEHNIESWNLAKVLLAHVPNLVVSTWHFAVHGNAAVFVAAQVLALVISTWVMRFPRYRPLVAMAVPRT